MADFWFFAFLNALLFVASTQNTLEAKTTDENEKCTVNLESCSLKVGGKSLDALATPGQKGEQGDRGEKGKKGEMGKTGFVGAPGPTGLPGQKGEPGLVREKGNQGPSGDIGPKGDTGRAGVNGPPGVMGSKGDMGEKGSPGPQGPPGLPGLPGSCPCLSLAEAKTDFTSKEDGSESNPAKVVCKEFIDPYVLKDYYYMGPGNMKLTCNIAKAGEEIWTCVPPKTKVTLGKDVLEEKSYWLSSKKVSLLDIYNLTHTQLAWIQGQSTSAKQKIRYHCQNSAPYNSADEDHSLLMLSWNDITFGPTPRESTPFVYSVPSETDGCMLPPNGAARSSLIEIKSDAAQRLPVVDFLIRDLRDMSSEIGVEHLELCFN